MKKINRSELLISVVIAELTGALSALLAGGYSDFYREIIRPPFSPPGAVFPVVWAVLYALMGVSAYLVCNADEAFTNARKRALMLYAVQLGVNFIWSILFFRFRMFAAAAAVAVLLSVLVLLMILQFGKVRKSAARLNVPYLLWSIFASYLAIGVWLLNA